MDLVSCDRDLLYGAGGLYEPDDISTRLSDGAVMAAPRIHRIGEIFPAETTERRGVWPAQGGSAGFREIYQHHCRLIADRFRHLPPAMLYALEDCAVLNNVLYLRDAPPVPIFETARACDRPAVTLAPEATFTQPVIPDVPGIARLFIGSAGTFNYGHWLVDDLGRTEAVRRILALPGITRVEILISSYDARINAMREQSILALCRDLPVSVRLIDAQQPLSFERLLFVTPISWHPAMKSRAALAYVADTARAARHLEHRTSFGRRLFVPRLPGQRRALANTQEALRLLAGHGFTPIDPAQLSFLQQVDAFAQAEIVVGAMGAAMTNCLFSPPGAQVIQLVPEGWVEPFFWDLADVRGHVSQSLFGTCLDAAAPAHESDFTVDLDLLRACLPV